MEKVNIKVRILANNDPDNWWGEMDTVTGQLVKEHPVPLYEIMADPDADDELEFKPGDQVYCLDDKKRGLCAAWKA